MWDIFVHNEQLPCMCIPWVAYNNALDTMVLHCWAAFYKPRELHSCQYWLDAYALLVGRWGMIMWISCDELALHPVWVVSFSDVPQGEKRVTIWGHWSFFLVSCAPSCDCICSNTKLMQTVTWLLSLQNQQLAPMSLSTVGVAISTRLGSDKWVVIKVKLGSDNGNHV